MSPSWMAQSPGEAPCLPFPPACAKGRRTLSRAGQAGLRKPSWHRRCHQGSRLPARSALNGAHRAPAPPDEGSCVPVARAQDRPERKRRPLRKAFRRKPFLPSCVCRRRLRPQGRRSHLPVRSAQSVCHRQTAPPHPYFSAAASVSRWATSHRDVAAL